MNGCRKITSHIFEAQPPLKPPHIHRFDGITRLGDQLGFHPAFGADEKNLRLRMSLFYFPRDGQSRIDMSRRAAAGHKYAHKQYLLSLPAEKQPPDVRKMQKENPPFRRRGILRIRVSMFGVGYVFSVLTPRDTESTTPICANNITNEVPP